MIFRPRKKFTDVVEELVKGFEDGSIVLPSEKKEDGKDVKVKQDFTTDSSSDTSKQDTTQKPIS